MAIDATGTPSTNLLIPKFNTAVDAPSGKGVNAIVDYIDGLYPLTSSTTWAAFNPAWTSDGTAPAIGDSTFPNSRWTRVGQTVHMITRITFGASATYGTGSYSFSLPVAAATAQANIVVGAAQLFDTTASQMYTGICRIDTGGTTLKISFPAVTNYDAGQTAPFTWAAGDHIAWAACYEAA